MKSKILCVILASMLFLAGCSPVVEDIPRRTSIYATTYPIYALTDMIAGEVSDIELHCLVQPQDNCLRSYELSDWDMYMLAYAADILIAGGNGFESFQEKLEKMGETSLPLIEVLYGLDMKSFTDEFDEDSHFSGKNPHIYMSVNGAEQILEIIANSLSLIDEKNSETYAGNLEKSRQMLSEAEDYVRKQTEVCTNKKVAVLNEALFYPAQDYGMKITAWYERENGEMLYEDSLSECLDRLKTNDVETVLIERQAPKALVDALRNAGYSVALMDIMTTHGESDGWKLYLNILKSNALSAAEACQEK